jgi:hypothetical protein
LPLEELSVPYRKRQKKKKKKKKKRRRRKKSYLFFAYVWSTGLTLVLVPSSIRWWTAIL